MIAAMKKIIRTIALCGIMATSINAFGQNTNSGYFVDNYLYRYQLNPAFGNEDGFVSIPAIGNFDANLQGTLNLTDVLYKYDGKTVLFSNPNISAAEVLSNVKRKNTLGANFRENIVSVGFKALGGYNTVSLNARADVNAMVPGAFFEMVKNGIENKTYDIRRIGVRAIGYGELALNHSHDIKSVPGLRVGAAVKFLVGMASVDARFHRADITLGTDEWTVASDADVYVNLGKFQYEQKINEKTGKPYVSGFNMDGDGSISPNGFGVAFDLGLNYNWRDFNFSIGVLDLGFLSFSDTKYATTGGTKIFNTDEHIFNPSDMDGSWDDFVKDFDKLYQLDDMGNIGSHTRPLAATLNLAIDYALPVYRKLKFGLLNSSHLAGRYTWSEVRLSANVAPVNWFSASINGAIGTYGLSFGWLLNFNAKHFNLFAGMDNTSFKFAKQGVPLKSNTSASFGINIPF